MKKKILWLISAIMCAFGFTLVVEAAAPTSIQAGKSTAITQYVNGYQAYFKTTYDGSRYLYCEVAKLKFPSNLTLTQNSEIDKGFVYILNNTPNTGDTHKNYYIMQMAIWWYRDYLSNNNYNLDSNFKNYCTNNRTTDSVCKAIYNLVEGAKAYKEPRGDMSFSSANINFALVNGYYVSDYISFTSENLATMKDLKLVGAPTGAQIINSSITTSTKKGTFQVRIPVSSITPGSTISFNVEVEGTYNTYSAYDYFYSSEYQKVIYDWVYTVERPIHMAKSLKVTRPLDNTNSLVIYKEDQDGNNLKDARLTLYSGNCEKSKCYSLDIYDTWTSTKSPEIFYNLPIGYYTVVEDEAPEGYKLADKGLIYIGSNNYSYYYTVVNVREDIKSVKISKIDLANSKEIAGATLVVKKSNGTEVVSWVSANKPKYLTLEEGYYTLSETIAPEGYKLNKNVIYFYVDSEGNVKTKNDNDKYVAAEEIKFTNESNDIVNISKLDVSTNAYLQDATLVIKNAKGEVVTTWTTGDASYNVALSAGDYTLEETVVPNGYKKTEEVIRFRVMEDGSLMIANKSGVYEIASGIIMYNEPLPEEEVIVVPKTGLSSIVTYTLGGLTLLSGAYLLKKNGEFHI